MSVTIASYQGPLEAEPIWIGQGIVVQPAIGPDGPSANLFSITHVRSGYAAAWMLERRFALELAKELATVGNWDRESTELYADHQFLDGVRAILKEYGLPAPSASRHVRKRIANARPLRPTDDPEYAVRVAQNGRP